MRDRQIGNTDRRGAKLRLGGGEINYARQLIRPRGFRVELRKRDCASGSAPDIAILIRGRARDSPHRYSFFPRSIARIKSAHSTGYFEIKLLIVAIRITV